MNDQERKPPAEEPAAQDEFGSAFTEAATPEKDRTPPEPEVQAGADADGGAADDANATPVAEARQTSGDTQPPPADDLTTALSGLDEKAREAVAARLKEAEDLRKLNETLRHRAHSDSGRVSALQRQLDKLQRQPIANAGQSSHNRDNPQAEGNRAALAKLQKLREDYPEIAGALEESITAIREEIQGTVRGAVAPIEEDAAQRAFAEQQKLLTDAHPDYVQVINGSEFQDWINGTPPSVRALMGSPHAADAKWLLDQYSEHTRKAQAAQQPPPAPPPASQSPRQSDRLARAVERPRRTAPAVPGASDDFEGAFNQFAKARS